MTENTTPEMTREELYEKYLAKCKELNHSPMGIDERFEGDYEHLLWDERITKRLMDVAYGNYIRLALEMGRTPFLIDDPDWMSDYAKLREIERNHEL